MCLLAAEPSNGGGVAGIKVWPVVLWITTRDVCITETSVVGFAVNVSDVNNVVLFIAKALGTGHIAAIWVIATGQYDISIDPNHCGGCKNERKFDEPC